MQVGKFNNQFYSVNPAIIQAELTTSIKGKTHGYQTRQKNRRLQSR